MIYLEIFLFYEPVVMTKYVIENFMLLPKNKFQKNCYGALIIVTTPTGIFGNRLQCQFFVNIPVTMGRSTKWMASLINLFDCTGMRHEDDFGNALC